ncbi:MULTISPECIES: metal-dependent hydrolase [Ktedonobacter]|uniref:Metal-dependent hydrolase n=1 Tax=Ktedonobacter robiniae TaxID=2778365 RepID=A0ABQ3UKG7_9CHLR|nr:MULTISPECIES: metal-dependent hydrolase [Ktedonobacter]GHO53150.1 hypothetical protein KSB_16250 [Ktedonobacter robiniae]GHO69370.1 hypothetical protein KSC_082620 [Ktedonobacter sp. SOSP1-52]
MEGRSHLLIGLVAGVVFDSVTHISGNALTAGTSVTLPLLVSKAVYYGAVGFGALLPDIDNARSTLGHRFGIISKTIQGIAGHRTVFHSLLGLAVGSLLAIGLERVVIYLLGLRGYSAPAHVVGISHVVFFGVLFGCVMHLLCDSLTYGGIPLFWPMHKRFGIPMDNKFRFRTGTWPEFLIVWGFMFVVAVCIWQGYVIL